MVVPYDKVDRPHLATFVLQAAELGLLLLLAHVFLIEQNYGFSQLIPIIFFGFIVHAWLPLQWRNPFFVLLFPASAFALLGPIAAAVLLSFGAALFLLCHLPIRLSARVGLLVATAITLAAVRVGAIETALPDIQMYFQTQTLPILGAIFMFRTAIYLYDLRNEKVPVSLWQRLGYFFLFPTVCFPLFPVIDYQTYKRTYYDRPSLEIYQKGMNWIFRGITHLLLYRIVYHYLVPDPLEIQDFAGVGQYALSSFLLYLRVSGLFHLIIGILCLFGFNLPETHHRYYLAESFTDFWRRINIYWKDFMVKMFYFPIFLSIRRWGTTFAMITATLVTFLITWLLHSYQWFWLRGTFTLHPQDMIFWGVLALLVTANSLYEEKYGRKRKSLTKHVTVSVQDALTRSIKIVTVFVTICLLWSFWTSTSIDQWIAVMSVAATATALEVFIAVLLFMSAIAAGVFLQLIANRKGPVAKRSLLPIPYRAAWIGAASILLLAVAHPAVNGLLNPQVEGLLAAITGDQLNTRDQQELVKGYYEELLGTESSGSMVWSVRLEQPKTWRWNGNPASAYQIRTDDIRGAEMRPSIVAIDKGREFRTNRWGMRDRDYEKTKPAGTYRIAMLGSSHALGAGVEVDETFPSLLEKYLNDGGRGSGYRSFELLNFANAGDSILRRLVRFQKNALDFDLDAVVDMSVTDERHLTIRQLRIAVRSRTPDIHPRLLDVIRRAEVTPEMSNDEIERRLGPYGDGIVGWAYRELALTAERHNVEVIVFVLPRVDDTDAVYLDEWRKLSKSGQDAGLTMVGLGGVYGSINKRSSLKLASWDWHPNAKGHALIAGRLYQELKNLGYPPSRIARHNTKPRDSKKR